MNKVIAIEIVVILFLSGVMQLFIFGDFTKYYGRAFNVHEDDASVNQILEIRRGLLHAID